MFFWACAFLAAGLVGLGKGGIPLIGALAVPVMALVISPLMAAGLLLPVYILSDAFALYAYRHHFDSRVLKIVLPGMVMGVFVGWVTASIVSERIITALVGVIGFSFSIKLLKSRQDMAPVPTRAKVFPGLFWGAVSGLTSFVSHSGGPPYQVYTVPLGMDRRVYAGTSTIAFAVINLVKLIPYMALGQVSYEYVKISALMMPAAAGAVFLGVQLVKWLPQHRFYQLIAYTLFAVSVKLIWDGLVG